MKTGYRAIREFSALGVALAAGVVSVSAASCSTSDRSFTGDAGTTALAPPDAAPLVTADACGGRQCSRDLKRVLDSCTGDTLQECGTGTACGNGECLDACSAAEISQGSAGCSFWTLPPDSATEGQQGSCYAALVANTWDEPVTISAEYGADALDISQSIYMATNDQSSVEYTKLDGPLAVGQVAIVFLAQKTGAKYACPPDVVPAVGVDPISHGTGLTKAFHLKASAPVSAYSIFPYGGAASQIPSATLLLPVSSWSKNSILVNPAAGFETKEITGVYRRRTSLQIVANDDDTQVRINPNADITDGLGVVGTSHDQPKTYTLSKGQVLQLTQMDELTGSAVESNKPFAVFGGAECHTFPNPQTGFCDSLQQQIPSLSNWGHDYALVPYKSRVNGPEKGVPWRFVGAVDGTVLTYDPAPPVGAPTTLNAGQVASFMTSGVLTVKSQDASHPFYAAVYMTGSMYNSATGQAAARTTGDPDFVNVVPSDQFLDHYVFFTDHTYANTTLTMVRRKTSKGFLPVNLDCAGEITGWAPVGTSGEYEYAWVQLTKTFQPQTFAGGSCGYGRQAASSDGPFSITVWGTDLDASYGFPGGMGLRPITPVTVTVPK